VRAVLLVALAGALVPAVACGKKGPPQAPLRRAPDLVRDVGLQQRGAHVVLTGRLPDRTQDGLPAQPIREVRIFRMQGNPVPPGFPLTSRAARRTAIRTFTRQAKRVAVLTGDDLARAVVVGRLGFEDTDPLPEPPSQKGEEVTYAVTAVDAEGRSSPLSEFAVIRIVPPPLPPANLRAEYTEKRIRLLWEPPAVTGSGDGLRYHVYRRDESAESLPARRNDKPLAQPFFDEEQFLFGGRYVYVVRTVAGEEGGAESEDSLPLQVQPVDVYPPAAPTGLAVSAEGGAMRVYWFPNGEPDLGGYRILRSESETGGFEPVGTAGPSETSFTDASVRPGVKYYYALTAVDRATPPNESDRSEIRGDRVPPAEKPQPGAGGPGGG
jgi:hypothetical protein